MFERHEAPQFYADVRRDEAQHVDAPPRRAAGQ
jgi:hypothetical protein